MVQADDLISFRQLTKKSAANDADDVSDEINTAATLLTFEARL